MTLDEVKQKYPNAATFTFGDNPRLCEELLTLVRSGAKSATCMALRDIESGAEERPVVGRQDISLNPDGTPALVIQTVELTQCAYDEVSESFALAEGENESLEGWREDHKRYFERNGGFDPKMQLLCERSVVVEDFLAVSAS